MNKRKNDKIIALIVAIVLIVVDQLLKLWVYNSLKPIGSLGLIPGFIKLSYVENRGAAFGIFQNGTAILAIVSLIMLVIILCLILFNKIKNSFLIWTLMVIFAGGFGNVIDRFTRGYVIDYLDFDIGFLKNFPVFNFADCCVTIGAMLLIIYILKVEPKKEDKILD